MSCPGLHCPGCSEGQSLGVLGGLVVIVYAADQLSVWVAEHIWEIGGTLAACFALSVAVSMWLERWAVIRGARFAAAHGIPVVEVIQPAVRAALIALDAPPASYLWQVANALDAGATDVVLYTDLANPTSNALYQRLGYRPVEDRLVLSFEPASS